MVSANLGKAFRSLRADFEAKRLSLPESVRGVHSRGAGYRRVNLQLGHSVLDCKVPHEIHFDGSASLCPPFQTRMQVSAALVASGSALADSAPWVCRCHRCLPRSRVRRWRGLSVGRSPASSSFSLGDRPSMKHLILSRTLRLRFAVGLDRFALRCRECTLARICRTRQRWRITWL